MKNKRTDHILQMALGFSNKEEEEDDISSCKDMYAAQKLSEPNGKKNETESAAVPLPTVPLRPVVKKIMDTDEYLCKTSTDITVAPLVPARKIIVGSEDDFIDSPVAPLYSPLTPLVAIMNRTNMCNCTEECFSPPPSMSPSTLEFFQNFDFGDDDIANNPDAAAKTDFNKENNVTEYEKDSRRQKSLGVETILRDRILEKGADKTVSSANNISYYDLNSEENSDGNESLSSSRLTVVATVHTTRNHTKKSMIPESKVTSNETKTQQNINSHSDKNSIIKESSSAITSAENIELDKYTQMQELTDIEVEKENVKEKDLEIEKNGSCDKISEDDVEEGDFSADDSSDYVPNSEDSYDDECLGSTLKTAAKLHTKTKSNLNTKEKGPSLKESSKEITNDDENSIHIEEIPIAENLELENESNVQNVINNIERQDEPSQISEGRPKRGRKRKHKEYTLKERNERKYANLPYHGKNKIVEPYFFKDYACSCKNQCNQLISKEKRKEEFDKYMSLGSYEAQLLYILANVKETPKNRTYTSSDTTRTGKKKKPKEFSRIYKICEIKVCRDMFANNFQITSQKINTSLRKNRNGGKLNDQRGVSSGGWNRTPEEDVDFIKNIINRLPKYESHYRRAKNSDTQYLQPGMTVDKIYDKYLEELKNVYGESKEPVKLGTLKKFFYRNFNLRCKTLKKDTCNRCDILDIQIKNATSNEEREKNSKARTEHLDLAEELKKRMNDDLKRAKTDQTFECLTYDLEKTLPLPRIPTNIVFYKRQLWLYNSGIHAGSNDVGHCFVWIEGEAGRGAQEVGSCLIKFIKTKLNPSVQHLVLWSDCCGGQNRNIKIVLMMKAVLHSHPNLKMISMKFLESGHTWLPNDTDFSKIEYQLKYHERIYTAEEYINVIKSCKKQKPLQVYRMKTKDFVGVRKIEKNIVNRKTYISKQKVNWLKTKEIVLKKDKMHSVFMKSSSHGDDFQELSIEKKIKGKSLSILENDFVLLWPNGKEIAQAKLDDLKSMFDLIPKDCLAFYKSLKGNEKICDDVDGFGGEPDFHIESTDQIADEESENDG